ncbi:MAG: DNRLRE domain-containing protein [Verrucomicrobiota bacterium]
MNYEERIDSLLEARLSEEEESQLVSELLADPELMSLYVERNWVHADLLSDHSLLADLGGEAIAKSSPSPISRIALAAAAVFALFSIFLLSFSGDSAPAPVATLIEAEDCRWEGSDLPTREGALLSPGILALAEGMATIRFESGATVTLEAPTTLEVESEMRCRLIEGSVVADVPDSAHGFTIDTEKLEVIDLGTKFGVTSTPVGGSHVFVFDGEVKVHQEDQEEARHLLSGKSLHLGAAPSSPDEEVSQGSNHETHLSDWVAVPTSKGRGKDAFIRRTYRKGMGRDPLLMVKHTELAAGNERRALLTFDLAKLNRDRMEEAKLTLKMESSGLGFSSLVPDSVFSVYAALSPSLHQWNESDLTWEGSPILTEQRPNESDFRKVAEFTIPKGSANSLIEVQSESLSEFLLKSEDQLATFLLVRETGEFDKQGLVHAFASKEHPSSPAPTLWFLPADQ